jgi:protein SCO1/2
MGTPDLQDPPAADPTAADRPAGSRRLHSRIVLPLIALVVIVGGVALLLGGGSGHNSSQSLPAGVSGAKSSLFQGSLLTPSKRAPALGLRNYLGGARVSTGGYRGRALLVTFIYTHCPDVCPLIAANLGVALHVMGPKVASKAQVVAVSVDPRGDTRQTVAAFLKAHGVTGRMLYLTGSAQELAHVWEAWGVGSERDARQPEFVNHSGLVYGVTASGKLTTVYPANFKPAEIAHDAPLLAAQ